MRDVAERLPLRAEGNVFEDFRPRDDAAERVARFVARDARRDDVVVFPAEQPAAVGPDELADEPQRHREREHAPEEQQPFGDGSQERGGDVVDHCVIRSRQGRFRETPAPRARPCLSEGG